MEQDQRQPRGWGRVGQPLPPCLDLQALDSPHYASAPLKSASRRLLHLPLTSANSQTPQPYLPAPPPSPPPSTPLTPWHHPLNLHPHSILHCHPLNLQALDPPSSLSLYPPFFLSDWCPSLSLCLIACLPPPLLLPCLRHCFACLCVSLSFVPFLVVVLPGSLSWVALALVWIFNKKLPDARSLILDP